MDDYTTRLSDIIVKAHQTGQLSDEERQVLQEAMKSVAPSSHEFQGISSALAAAGRSAQYHPGEGDLRSQIAAQTQQPASLPAAPQRPPGIYMDGLPTGDWAADLGGVKDAIINEIQDPFGGNPELRTDWEEPSWDPASTGGTDSRNTSPDPSYHANDPNPLPGQSSTKNIAAEMNGGIPGPQLAAGHGLEWHPEDDVADVSAVNFPGGYSFSNSNETAVDMYKYNPELFNRNITERVLGQPGMEEYWKNKTAAAMNLASFGVLGDGNGRSDLGGGPTTSTGQLAATEDFMKQFAQPGVQVVDPGQVYEQVFQRALDTDWSKQISRRGEGNMGVEEQIATTNDVLLTSMAFSNPETEAWMTSLLEDAKMQYMDYLAQGGDPTVSYPKFLDQTMGFSDLL